jgi:predicted Fe-Mo cluster-binding NifX family protein
MRRIIGIPSDGTEISDNISSHFGHCRYFIGIEIDKENGYQKVFTMINQGHNGCMEPVINMKERNVTDMILTGIGMRPFMGFQQVQIKLYQGVQGSIENNLRMLLNGHLRLMNDPSCADHSDQVHTH